VNILFKIAFLNQLEDRFPARSGIAGDDKGDRGAELLFYPGKGLQGATQILFRFYAADKKEVRCLNTIPFQYRPRLLLTHGLKMILHTKGDDIDLLL